MALTCPIYAPLFPRHVDAFLRDGYLVLDLLDLPNSPFTQERLGKFSQAVCKHLNKLVHERHGPADHLAPDHPTPQAFCDSKARDADPTWEDKKGLFKETPAGNANSRRPLFAGDNGMGFGTTVYDLDDQEQLQKDLVGIFAQLYDAINKGQLTRAERTNLVVNKERFGFKQSGKSGQKADKRDMPRHADMAFCKDYVDKPLREVLNPADPQTYKPGQRIQCVVHANDGGGGWYGWVHPDPSVNRFKTIGDLLKWPGKTKGLVNLEKADLEGAGFERVDVPSKTGRAVFWLTDIPHGNMGVASDAPPRIVFYANVVPAPLAEGQEEPTILFAEKVVGLGNHKVDKPARSTKGKAAHQAVKRSLEDLSDNESFEDIPSPKMSGMTSL